MPQLIIITPHHKSQLLNISFRQFAKRTLIYLKNTIIKNQLNPVKGHIVSKCVFAEEEE